MQDDKRMPARLPVPSRQSRDIEPYGGSGGHQEQSVPHILLVAWRRRGVVLASLVLALAVGVVYLMKATPVYSASSVVYVQQPGRIYNENEMTSGSTTTGYLFTQCELIRSTNILTEAMSEPGVADAKMLQRVENPVGYIKACLSATPAKQGDLIAVSMESPNPQDAATIVNGVVAAYIEYESRQHQSSAVQVAKILQKEYDSHDQELKEAQQGMLKLRREHPDLGLMSDKGGVAFQRAAELNGELGVADIRADDLRTAKVAIDATDPNDLQSLRAVVDMYQLTAMLPPSSLQPAAAAYADAKARLAAVQDAGLGAGSQAFQRAQLNLERTGAEMAGATRDAAAGCVRTVHAAADMADRRVKQLQAAIEGERKLTTGLSVEEAEYDQLVQQASRSERALDLLSERLKSSQVIETETPTTVTVLETAKAVPFPVRPLPSHVLAVAAIGGILAGVGAGMLFDKLDKRLRSVEEVATLLDAAILGVVPRIVRRILPGEAGREIQNKPRSGVAEAFRTVRTAIYFGGAERAGKTILVTSPTPGDGKSTCVSNLAIAVAQGGRRTLLIDADCRRPVQHKTFKLDDKIGLSSVLTGRATLDEAIQHTDVERLDVLPCGPLPHNPAELLDSQPLLDLLAEAGRRYDQVLVDSPPVTLVSDARVLAAGCDASMLVLRSERSTRRGATLAWNALSSVGANLLGVIVNDLSRQKDGYGYSYYGYGRYGYTPAKPNGELPHNGNGNGQSTVITTVD